MIIEHQRIEWKVDQTSHGAPVGTKLALSRHQVAVLLKCRIDSKLVEMTCPKKPTSSKQMYRITDRGIQVSQNTIELYHA